MVLEQPAGSAHHIVYGLGLSKGLFGHQSCQLLPLLGGKASENLNLQFVCVCVCVVCVCVCPGRSSVGHRADW